MYFRLALSTLFLFLLALLRAEAKTYGDVSNAYLRDEYLRRVMIDPKPQPKDLMAAMAELGISSGFIEYGTSYIQKKSRADEKLILPQLYDVRNTMAFHTKRLRKQLNGFLDLGFAKWFSSDWVNEKYRPLAVVGEWEGVPFVAKKIMELDQEIVKVADKMQNEIKGFVKNRYGDEGAWYYFVAVNLSSIRDSPERRLEKLELFQKEMIQCQSCKAFAPFLWEHIGDLLQKGAKDIDSSDLQRLCDIILEEMTYKTTVSESYIPVETAEEWYHKGEKALSINDYETAVSAYRNGLTFDNWSEEQDYYNCRIGEAYFYNKRYDEAIASFNRAVSLNEKNKQAYYYLGKSFFANNETAKAISAFGQAIKIDPAYAGAYYDLGWAYYKYKQYEEAIVNFKKTEELKPVWEAVPFSIGVVYFTRQKYDNAIHEFQKVININPNYIKAYLYLGESFFKKQDYPKAIFWFKKVIELDTRSFLGHVYLGNLYYERKLYDQAIPFYARAMELDPQNAQPVYYLADVYYHMGLYDEAIPLYNKSLILNPKLSLPSLGFCYFQKGNLQEALLSLQAAALSDPKQMEVYIGLGEVYEALGRVQEAVSAYKKYLELAPKDEDNSYLRRKIKELSGGKK